MVALRPLVALLLALLVAVQVTELVPCADEREHARREATEHGTPGHTDDLDAAPHGSTDVSVDCLCHAVVVPGPPLVGLAGAAVQRLGAWNDGPRPGPTRTDAPPVPVPLG